jgi:predicted PurR-regulated permease PerM
MRNGIEPNNKPIPVEVRQPDLGALQMLTAFITPLIHPLATTGIVAIFVIFILLQHQDLRNRLVRLAGAQDLQRTTAARRKPWTLKRRRVFRKRPLMCPGIRIP